jgi:hypothetical protein
VGFLLPGMSQSVGGCLIVGFGLPVVYQSVGGCLIVGFGLPVVYQFVGGFCNNIIKVVLGCKIIYILLIIGNTSGCLN